MRASRHQDNLQFQRDHEKAQELLGRYAEIQQMAGGAESMYPAIAAHLGICKTCRNLLDDLMMPSVSHNENLLSSRAVVLGSLHNEPPTSAQVSHPPLDLVFREEIILRLGHVLPTASTLPVNNHELVAAHEMPTAGYLLYYDTLAVGRLDLVVIFTLSRSNQPNTYQIEGIVSPDQPVLCYSASLEQDGKILEAKVRSNRLVFDGVSLDPAVDHMTVTLDGRSRWCVTDHPALKSSGTRSGV